MEVILKQDVKNLGNKDEIVKVKNGYGRNYLIPKGMAILATESNVKVLNENLRQRAHKEEKLRTEAEKIAAKLTELSIKIGAKVGESGRIYGSVNSIQLSDSLRKLGFEIDRRNIQFDEESIKTLGTYKAHVKLYKDIKTDIEFEVVAE
jgi:large subunit ribosomal protein L9